MIIALYFYYLKISYFHTIPLWMIVSLSLVSVIEKQNINPLLDESSASSIDQQYLSPPTAYSLAKSKIRAPCPHSPLALFRRVDNGL